MGWRPRHSKALLTWIVPQLRHICPLATRSHPERTSIPRSDHRFTQSEATPNPNRTHRQAHHPLWTKMPRFIVREVVPESTMYTPGQLADCAESDLPLTYDCWEYGGARWPISATHSFSIAYTQSRPAARAHVDRFPEALAELERRLGGICPTDARAEAVRQELLSDSFD